MASEMDTNAWGEALEKQLRTWEFKPSRKCSWSTAGKVCED